MYKKCFLYRSCWIIDPVTMRKVRNQVILLHQVDGKKFYNEKTWELLGQISKSKN